MPLLLLQPTREAHIKKDGHQNYDRQAFQIVGRAAQRSSLALLKVDPSPILEIWHGGGGLQKP